jgi:CheY-like chemotaxis protein
MMPGMDGFMLAEQVRADATLAATVLLLLTSADRQGDTALCRQLGVAAYLVKPVKPAELNRAVAAALAAAPAPAPPAAPRPAGATPPPARSLRILLAEDNPVNQRVLLGLLEKHGHAATVAADGRQALAALDRAAFDLVLMDVQMPVMDGFEATREIRAREQTAGPRTRVVAMTAHAMKGDRERCLAAGMDDYLSKPVQRAELARVLDWAAGKNTPPPADAPPALDRQSALQRFDGDEELFAEVVAMFLADAPRALDELRGAVAAGDAATVHRAAHGLKGAAGYVGGTATVGAAAALEHLTEGGDRSAAPAALERLAREVGRLTAALADSPAPVA